MGEASACGSRTRENTKIRKLLVAIEFDLRVLIHAVLPGTIPHREMQRRGGSFKFAPKRGTFFLLLSSFALFVLESVSQGENDSSRI